MYDGQLCPSLLILMLILIEAADIAGAPSLRVLCARVGIRVHRKSGPFFPATGKRKATASASPGVA